MAASYPTSIKTNFAAKAHGHVIYASHLTDIEDEVVAIETALKTGPTVLAAASFSGAVTLTGGLNTPLIVAQGGTGLATLTNKSVLVGAGTGNVAGVAPSTSGNVLTSDGTDWASTAGMTGNVTFPASQSASAGANVLDDYEEGTWTPALGGSGGQSGQVYGLQQGIYTKVGRLVTCFFLVQLSTLGTITSYLNLTGLPFTAANPGFEVGTPYLRYAAMNVNWVNVQAHVLQSSTTARVRGANAAAAANTDDLVQGDLSATSLLAGQFSYTI